MRPLDMYSGIEVYWYILRQVNMLHRYAWN